MIRHYLTRERRIFSAVLVAFLLLGTDGCSTGHSITRSNAQAPYLPSRAPGEGDILHIRTGYFVSEEVMLSAATDARIVYIGEVHNNMESHRQQLKVVRAMVERWPGQVAIGMEMFIPEQQQALDAWVAGEISETDFLEESKWRERWNIDFNYYKPLLLFAREYRIPVIGLNVPKTLVRAVAKKDFQELTDEERRQLPDIDMNTPYRDALTQAYYGGHTQSENGLAGFQRVQALWDEGMAENAVRYLNSADGQDRHMVIIAGGNHIRYGIGIPRAVFRRFPSSYVLLGTSILAIEERDKGEIMNVDLPEFPMTPFDFITFVRYDKLPDTDKGNGSETR